MTIRELRETTQKKKKIFLKLRIVTSKTEFVRLNGEKRHHISKDFIRNEDIKRSNKIMAKKPSMIKSAIPHFR